MWGKLRLINDQLLARISIRKLGERERDKSKRKVEAAKGGVGLETNYDGYAECYPGLEEMNDAIDDSDDEADYSKMDLGNKKGPVGRWDFDTAEEYAEYKSKQEALPKAAFQYGVKMTEGKNKKEVLHEERASNVRLELRLNFWSWCIESSWITIYFHLFLIK